MPISKTKVAVIGNGFVGASAAYAMAIKGLAAEMVLIDVNKEKSYGEALDINHGISLLSGMKIYSGDYSDCKDCDVIVITAGVNRKPGETRLDLAKKNASIMKDITSSVMKYYTKGIVLIVSNPVDVLTYKFQEWSGLPAKKVIGSGTLLDTSRFKFHLGEKLGVDANDVNAYIIGEHGDSQIPLWSHATIGGMKLDDYCSLYNIPMGEEEKKAIAEEVKQAGATVIKSKGATYYAIALSINKIVEAVLKDQNAVLPLGNVIKEGPYGLKNVALSMPSIINSEGIERMIELKLNDEEIKFLNNSAQQISNILKELENI